MPFQSEKQRKYLWANEPAIARDWTDKYGSRVKKQLGGGLNIGYHGSPWYQDILSQGFKGSRIPTWAGFGKTFTSPSMNVAARYGTPIEVAQSARNFTLPFGGGIGKGGISFGAETPLRPGQATKGMDFMQRLRAGQYPNSATAQRLLRTGATAAPRLGILGALSSLGGQAAAGLPLAYTYGASKLQESLPMSLIGEGGLSDQNPYFGAMGVSVDPTVEEILRYGDEGKPSPDTGEGSTLAGIWDAIKNEFGGSAEAAGIPINKITQDEETFIDPKRIPDRIRGVPMSIPRKMGMLERFRNKFYKPAAGAVNYGGRTYSPAQLNSMNALGGYYSEPARAERRRQGRIGYMLNRGVTGKPIGDIGKVSRGLYTKDQSGNISYHGAHEGSSTAGAGYSRSDSGWSSSPFRRGGLASLWQR